ncbi:HaeII family restriction endonuclease [Bernardetia sp. OM2101]|uniref:HaeII family restriction endonuclease n=1 Tax=Bernardetia sp. OM2101 TaxID=3344876 RepID=UPI0035CFE9B8
MKNKNSNRLLKRSLDKIYEIIVFALFSSLVEVLEIDIEVSYSPSKKPILEEFSDFTSRILNLSTDKNNFKTKAKIHRVGVTNAADRGLDMWSSFGLAIQIKHLSLNEEMAENIVNSITADRIVIVCKKAEQKIILSLLNQIGWKSKIQTIVTEVDLINWYEKALRGENNNLIGHKVIEILNSEIETEFPATKNTEFEDFVKSRNYQLLYT